MTRTEIIAKVRVKLDEISPSSKDLVISFSEQVKPIDQIIDDLLDSSLIDVLQDAPLGLVPTTTLSGSPTKYAADTVGTFTLPSDFLRLVNMKLTSWTNMVTSIKSSLSPDYHVQSNKFTRGGETKPMAFLIDTKELELFPVNTSDTVSGKYVAEISDITTASDRLVDALSWYVASQVYQIMGLSDNMNLALQGLQQLYSRY